MADVKISQLPVATTPLDGTEVLPIVQSATTKQVSIANVTAGRAVSALSLSLTNALPVTSGGTGIATAAQGSLLSATDADTFSATRTPTLGLAGTAAGTLGLSGSTSGVVTLATASGAAGTWTMRLPTTGGTNNYLLKTDGSGNTDWVNPTALGIDLDVGTTAITNGTAGRVFFQGSGDVLQQSANLFWDNTNSRLGIGTASPSYLLHAYGNGDNAARIHAQNVGSATDSRALISFSTNASTFGAGLFLSSTADTAYVASALNLFTFDNQPIAFGTGNTLKMTLDLSGNLGLGVTPSAWDSAIKAFQINNQGAVWSISSSNPNVWMSANTRLVGSTYYYVNAGVASYYGQSAGQHQWYNAASGAAGSAISFTQAMTLDASGRLGIGTTTPAFSLDSVGTIRGRGDYYFGFVNGSQAGVWWAQTNYAVPAFQGLTSAGNVGDIVMQLGGGNVGIGTTAPTAKLHVRGGRSTFEASSEPYSLYVAYNSSTSGVFLGGTSSGGFQMSAAGGSSWLNVDSSGNLLVGATSVASGGKISAYASSNSTRAVSAVNTNSGDISVAPLYVSKYDNNSTTSNVLVQFAINNQSTGSGQINANGASAAAFGSYSDSRLKDNIVSLPNQLANILALLPREFDYLSGGHQIGFIAQEMQEVYPDVIGEGDDGMLTITGWSKTEARLVSAIQELAAKVSALEAKQ